MGAVYRATDSKVGHDVAIKVLPECFANETDLLARFARGGPGVISAWRTSRSSSVLRSRPAPAARGLIGVPIRGWRTVRRRAR
jgi:hypothetical protein